MALLGAGSAVGQSAARPTFTPHRFDEDWRRLCTSVGRGEHLDALKCLMLGPAVTLSFGGEARARYEAFDNPGFGLRSSGHDVLLNRFLFHGDLRVSDTVRAFLQFGYAWGDGRDGASLSTDTDRLDAVQAFLEVSTEVGPGGLHPLSRTPLRGFCR